MPERPRNARTRATMMPAKRPLNLDTEQQGMTLSSLARLTLWLGAIALASCNALVRLPQDHERLIQDPPTRLSELERLRFTIENLGEVEPGLLYRSANPGRGLLEFLVRRVDLKYVVNLRGTTDPENEAFMESKGGRIINLPMSASRPPNPDQVLELIRVTHQARREGASILIHCMAGADRTGMMVGSWRMLFQGARDREALMRETLMYRHLPPAWPNVHRHLEVFRPELFQDFVDNPSLLDDDSLTAALEERFLLGYPLLESHLDTTSGPLRAGTARADLVEGWSGPVQMATYGPSPPMSAGVRHPVYARALVLDNGASRLALVSCDLLIMHSGLRAAVIEKVSAKAPRLDTIMLSATHTHTSVGGYVDDPLFGFYMLGKFDPEWADHLAARIAAAITEANSSLRKARLGCGRTFVDDASHNRRIGEAIDPEVALIKITDDEEKPLALVVNFAGHPILEPDDAMISPDYPGLLAEKLDADFGFGFFLQGALGDLNAGSKDRGDQWKQPGLAEAVAERLHKSISRVYDAIPVQAEQRLSSLTASFRLPEVDFNLMPDLLFPLEWLFSSLISWPDEYPLQGIRIGDAAIIATASELSGRLGRQVKRDSPAPFTLVASHCGDYAGYALAQAYHARKKLDASSIAALGGPSHGPQLARSAASLLNALWDEKEKTTSAPRLSPAALHRISWPEGTITDEERARLLAVAAGEENRELGLSIDPTLPQSRSHAALVGGSLNDSLRIDLYTAWHDRVRGASGVRGNLRDTGLRLSAEIPAQLRVDLELGRRSSSWRQGGDKKRSDGSLGAGLGIEKVFTISSSAIDGNALRVLPRLELNTPGGAPGPEEPFAFAPSAGVWRPALGGGIEYTWNTSRTLSAQTLYTTSIGDRLGRRPGDHWESLLAYSERHGSVSLHLRAEAALWQADYREGGLAAADLEESSWGFALRPGLSFHLGESAELFIEGRLPIAGEAPGAGNGSGLFIGLTAGF